MSRRHLPPLVRGTRWSYLVGLEISGFDWTGVTVDCQLRARDGRLICDLGATNRITISEEDGVFKVLLDVPGSVTGTWVGHVTGDIRISRGSPAWGPYVPEEFQFEVRSGDST